MVKGWTILSVKRASGKAVFRKGWKPYSVRTKHINGHEEQYALEAIDELHAWQQMVDWIDKAYKD